jgi:E3 ubiquitin-protein ligase HERC2
LQLQGKKAIQIVCGFRHTFVLTQDGQVYAWGYGRHGVLGDGTDKAKTIPTLIKMTFHQISGNSSQIDINTTVSISKQQQLQQQQQFDVKIVSLRSGGMHTCALSSEGHVYSWGEGRGFKTGHDTQDDVMFPRLIDALREKKVTQLCCSSTGGLALHDGVAPPTEYMQLEDAMTDIRTTVRIYSL